MASSISWVALWISLVVFALLVLSLTIVFVARRFVRLFRATTDLLSLGSRFHAVEVPETERRPSPAVLLGKAESKEAWEAHRHSRAERRSERVDVRLRRARELTSAAAVMPERIRG